MKERATRVVDKIVKMLEFLTGFCASIMLISIMWQVFTRFIVKTPSIWTEEIARYSFIYMAMFGAAVGVKKGSHFGMTLFTDRLKGRARDLYMRYVVNLTIVICSIIIVFYGWDFAIQFGMTRVSPTFLVPMTWVFISIPLTGVFMLVFALYNIIFEDYSKEVSLEEELRNQEIELNI
ncbi:TRAP-type C4-dicarboxylate transport system permease small subunit [Anaerosolibacter carboniphilus]|uniref:TRAP-type C4-dicarboxylate transport system permease small subunit n=1 Tax=Anaerosolibacter carboniphilus TaxID=1417629 RepID=A0A841KUZ8_9FIRM|nr:TRAP transporter small permease [Anaerosolibacter carboniphilus]MBB6217281.1 TRAP-type C4-dicarboxylate transport system permease small subunit [Anaerosolibacter carboniphilus]